jgi:hypothetical protein
LGKPNYRFNKRQKELARKRKKEIKRQNKLEKDSRPEGDEPQADSETKNPTG